MCSLSACPLRRCGRGYGGNTEVTDLIDASRFHWKRQSSDETGDAVWNAAHAGVKQIYLTTADVHYSALQFILVKTFRGGCSLSQNIRFNLSNT